MFKSVVDTTPLLFVKMAQQQIGAVDFSIKAANDTSLQNFNKNPYAVDPFTDPWETNYTIPNDTQPLDSLGIPGENETALKIYQDHIYIADSIPIMRTPYFTERLSNLTEFDGFVGRWYFPGEKLVSQETNTSAIVTALVIDTANEISVGVGYDWPPVVLGEQEMQL